MVRKLEAGSLISTASDPQDYRECDADVNAAEHLLTTLFPDYSVRNFMLDLGASLLRKRNRFKHFYVFTGTRRGLG